MARADVERSKMPENEENEQGSERGFASMPKEEVREIAKKGGEASGGRPENLEGVDRSEAGRKGGEAVAEKYGPEHMAEIGKKGGEESGGSRQGGNQQGGRGSNLSEEGREEGGENSQGGNR
jgi:general stress protein YciG